MDRFRVVVACGLAASLLASGRPAGAVEKPLLPEQVYFQVEGQIYRFDYRSAAGAADAFGEPFAGCDEWLVRQAVFAGGEPRRGFAPAARPSAEGLVYLGAREADVRSRTGRDLAEVQMWAPVVTHRLCRSESGIFVEQDTGVDRVTYAFDWDAAAPVAVSVNGWTEAIDAARVVELSREMAAGHDPAGEPWPAEFAALGSRLNEPAVYGGTLYGLLWAAQALDGRYAWPPVANSAGKDCGWPCFQCGTLGLGLLVGGTAALVAGCGASVATLGASCIAAGVGYMSAVMGLMGKCLDCCVCMGSCKKGGKDGGAGSGKDDDNCPDDFHPCCNVNTCCSDTNPPACCLPPCP